MRKSLLIYSTCKKRHFGVLKYWSNGIKGLLSLDQLSNHLTIQPFKIKILEIIFLKAILLLSLTTQLIAHEVRPGYLEIIEQQPGIYAVAWKVPLRNGRPLDIEPVFPKGFRLVGEVTQQKSGGAIVERWKMTSGKLLVGQTVRIDGLQKTLTDVLVRISLADGRIVTERLTAKSPSLVASETPSTWSVAVTYTELGIEHILLGIDHLLFVLALLLIVHDRWKLIKTITAFTIAHSITLAIATLDLIYLPGPPVEAVIALSIVFVAAEILNRQHREPGLTERYPWIVAFSFGLLHGFGFAGALSDIGLPRGEIPMALLTFNIGVELGQLFFVALVLVVQQILKKVPISWPEWSWKVLPYAIGSIAVFWVIERVIGFL